MKIGVTVPILNNFEGGLQLIASVASKEHDVHFYIEEQYRHRKPLAQAWNHGFERAVKDSCEYVFIVNDDILFNRDTVDNAVKEYERLESEKVILISANNVHDEIPDPQNIVDIEQPYSPGSYSDNPNYSCFMVRKDFMEKVGTFDENFVPAWCEDQDSHHRIVKLGYKAICTTAVSCVHFGGVSTKLLGNNDSSRSVNYFIRKWGSHNPHPPQAFEHPYNNPNLTAKDWIPNYV